MLSKKGKTFDLDLDSETDSESSANEYGCSDPGQEECKETEVGERKSCPRPGGKNQSKYQQCCPCMLNAFFF